MCRLAQVAISFNSRTYRFQCGEDEAPRLEMLANHLKSILDKLMREHGMVGDERLVIMAALTMADELFEARADIDELLDDQTGAAAKQADKLTDRQTDKLTDKLKAAVKAAESKSLVPIADPARKILV